MIRAIIFDLDGTLVDAYPGLHQSLNEMLRSLGMPDVSFEVVKRRVGGGVLSLIRQSVSAELVERGLQLFRESYDRTHLEGTRLLPGVRETLQYLRLKSLPLAVASNKPVEFTTNILRRFELDTFFLMIAGPNVRPKPDPAMIRSILESLQVQSEETLYVGDMTLDAETARNAGVQLALIATGGHSREELEKENPDYLLDGFADLIGIIETKI